MNMGPIRVRAILNRGDDRPLPAAVTLEGLDVPTSGTYDILNALVCSNGDLRLVVDGATSVVRAAEGVGAPSFRGYSDLPVQANDVITPSV